MLTSFEDIGSIFFQRLSSLISHYFLNFPRESWAQIIEAKQNSQIIALIHFNPLELAQPICTTGFVRPTNPNKQKTILTKAILNDAFGRVAIFLESSVWHFVSDLLLKHATAFIWQQTKKKTEK